MQVEYSLVAKYAGRIFIFIIKDTGRIFLFVIKYAGRIFLFVHTNLVHLH